MASPEPHLESSDEGYDSCGCTETPFGFECLEEVNFTFLSRKKHELFFHTPQIRGKLKSAVFDSLDQTHRMYGRGGVTWCQEKYIKILYDICASHCLAHLPPFPVKNWNVSNKLKFHLGLSVHGSHHLRSEKTFRGWLLRYVIWLVHNARHECIHRTDDYIYARQKLKEQV